MKLIVLIAFLVLAVSVFAEEATYEIVAATPVGPGNIAVSPEGRIFITLHQIYNPNRHVVEVLEDGSLKPFPTENWQKQPSTDGIGLATPLGVQVDQNNVLWIMDNGSMPPRLIGWDVDEDKLHKILAIPHPVSGEQSFINDMAVDRKHEAVYFADMRGDEGPAIIVGDLTTHRTRRVLVDHPSVRAEADATMIIEGGEVRQPNGEPHRNGLNPITVDPANEWVYYGAMHGTSVYRIRTSDLLDEALSPEELGERVERYGDKPVSDGITVDDAGNVYITDVTGMGIGVTKPDGSYELLFSDDSLVWPDSLSIGPDNYIYSVINQLSRSAPLNAGQDSSEPPFHIIRFKALADATVGR